MERSLGRRGPTGMPAPRMTLWGWGLDFGLPLVPFSASWVALVGYPGVVARGDLASGLRAVDHRVLRIVVELEMPAGSWRSKVSEERGKPRKDKGSWSEGVRRVGM